MPTTAPGSPLIRADWLYDSAPNSTRATSRMRTVEPSARAVSTIFSNSSTLVSWPDTLMVAVMVWPLTLGVSPKAPAEICRFCALIAPVTLDMDKP